MKANSVEMANTDFRDKFNIIVFSSIWLQLYNFNPMVKTQIKIQNAPVKTMSFYG